MIYGWNLTSGNLLIALCSEGEALHYLLEGILMPLLGRIILRGNISVSKVEKF